ncbi:MULTISPECIES: SMI1/KNR4 family protein [unclassified Amycolatopsis]|uniref:SMI1/KNR4 family protein n=1 Tax=unclassified Amycolatopsis TaxID=2618356 RepID=UPI0028745422|nr:MULTISPECIES: SMI1/KNR4 family protein [unclassified Amycolatopsis]MDS0140210.1 SMI1/KNR4 family protein [Amycolatopsis sp. 505]MDS0149589.1 SMI1/KNR4 family protein [Amycolatopsis sp. CM201R]
MQDYLEAAVRDVLTAPEARVDDQVGYAALLLAASGALDEADRLVTQWQARTERPVTALAADPVRARAWAMLFEARGARPAWAEGLAPLDLDAEERAHAASLRRPVSDVEGVLPPGPVAEVVKRVAPARPDRVRTALAEGDLARWASLAGPHPDVATLAATRALAPALVAGADPLQLGDGASACAGALVAALHERYPRDLGTWPELVAEILRLRGGATAPPPASEAAIRSAELRLDADLPADHREFLRTCDGLPADVVFPRLLGTADLRAEDGVVILSDPAVLLLSAGHVVEVDPVLGTTVHPSFRAALVRHATLLAQAG